jgi:hypothetical protein
MKTNITTAHEEEYSDGSKTLGVLFNYSDDGNFKEGLIYIYKKGIYKNGMYIFFNTMIDMMDYLLYAETKVQRAYMEEDEFDKYYDADYIQGKFSDLLAWQ